MVKADIKGIKDGKVMSNYWGRVQCVMKSNIQLKYSAVPFDLTCSKVLL